MVEAEKPDCHSSQGTLAAAARFAMNGTCWVSGSGARLCQSRAQLPTFMRCARGAALLNINCAAPPSCKSVLVFFFSSSTWAIRHAEDLQTARAIQRGLHVECHTTSFITSRQHCAACCRWQRTGQPLMCLWGRQWFQRCLALSKQNATASLRSVKCHPLSDRCFCIILVRTTTSEELWLQRM